MKMCVCGCVITFISSTNDGKPPIDMKVTKPRTKEVQDPLD